MQARNAAYEDEDDAEDEDSEDYLGGFELAEGETHNKIDYGDGNVLHTVGHFKKNGNPEVDLSRVWKVAVEREPHDRESLDLEILEGWIALQTLSNLVFPRKKNSASGSVRVSRVRRVRLRVRLLTVQPP